LAGSRIVVPVTESKLTMLLWTEQFATGSPTIDEQHRQLIRHLNHFEALLVETNPTPENLATLIRFLDFLESYVDSHFSYEEQCMESYRCPAHKKNLQAHENFKQTFHQFKLRSQKEGFRLEMLTELNQTINTWVQDHILRVDTQLLPCIAKNGQ
jgi:hemerythrin